MTFKFLGKNRWRRSSLTSILSNNDNCRAAATGVSASALSLEPRTDVGAFASSGPPERVGSVCQLPLIRKSEWGFRSMHHFHNIATLRDAQYLKRTNESISRPMPLQIVDALRSNEKARAFDMLLHLGQSLSIDDFVHILEHCAIASDPLFAWETWQIIDEREIRLNHRSCLLLLEALCRGGDLEKGFNFLHRLGQKGSIFQSVTLYNYFLRACRELENANLAGQCLDLMENRHIRRNEATYVELLKLAVWQKSLPAVHEFWKDCIKQHQINLILLQKFVWSFRMLGDFKSAYETLQIMVSIFSQSTSNVLVFPSRSDVPIPSTNDLNLKRCSLEDTDTLIETLGSPGNCKRLSMIFSPRNVQVESDRKGTSTDISLSDKKMLLQRSFDDVIHACSVDCNDFLAEQLVQQMQNIGLEPSRYTFDRLVRAFVHARNVMDGFEVLMLMEKKKLMPFPSTIATLSIMCSKSLELDLAENLLKEISTKKVIPYNALLKACLVVYEPERACRVLKRMKEDGLQPDIRTYELLFALFGNLYVPYEEDDTLAVRADVERRISALQMDMARNGVQHDVNSIHNLLRVLGKVGSIEKLWQYFKAVDNDVVNHNEGHLWSRVYTSVLHSLVEADQISAACRVFKGMESGGVPLDAATYNIMIDCCSKAGSVKSAYGIVSVMMRKGYIPNIVIYTTLIKCNLEVGDYDEALNCIDQAISEGIKCDVWSFNTIIHNASQVMMGKRIDVIEHIVEKMHREKVRPDSTTCWHVFDAYIIRGLFNTAMEALEVLCVRMILSQLEEEEEEEEKKKKVIEDYEALIYYDNEEGKGGGEAERAIMSIIPEEYRSGDDMYDNLVFAILCLRWCAILKGGLPINWSPEQSPWSQRLSANFDEGESFNERIKQ